MAAEKSYDSDTDLSAIQSKKVAIIDYGSQGRARTLNLHGSGAEVVVGLRGGSTSVAKAKEAGLSVKPIAEVATWVDAVAVLIPDQVQATLYRGEVEPNIKVGSALLLSHDFNIYLDYIKPLADIDAVVAAPKGLGHTVRRKSESGRDMPVFVCVEQDTFGAVWDLVLSYAKAIGGTRADATKATFHEETEINLFGEQPVLCGSVSKLIQCGFETLVEIGYQPGMVYFEICHEVKLIVDLISESGIFKQRWSCSDTAGYGDCVSDPCVITPEIKERTREILSDIQDGTFAKRFMDNQAADVLEFKKLRAEDGAHPIEAIGCEVRSMFTWRADANKDCIEGSVAR